MWLLQRAIARHIYVFRHIAWRNTVPGFNRRMKDGVCVVPDIRASGMRVVYIVDDDDAIRDSMRLLMESYGLRVREFPSATAYLNDMPMGGGGCLLLDLHMPGMSGLELLEILRGRRINIPAVIITGRADPSLAERIERAGVLALLHKPVGDADIVALVTRALDGVQSTQPQTMQ